MQSCVRGGISSSLLRPFTSAGSLGFKSWEHGTHVVPWKGSFLVFTLIKPQKDLTVLWKVNAHLEQAAFDLASAHCVHSTCFPEELS